MEWPARGLREFESYLDGAEVFQTLTHSLGGGGHPSFLVVLAGGVGVLVKQETASDDAPKMIRREAAAWILARGMGWPDLVSATILRDLKGLGGTEPVQSSMQVLWPANQPGVAVEDFSQEDLWRAGVFDAAIRATDRHAANWLGVPANPVAGQQRLKLVDHGHAFDLGRALQTPFYDRLQGETIPDECMTALEAISPLPDEVDDLLETDERSALDERIDLLREGVLDIKEP